MTAPKDPTPEQAAVDVAVSDEPAAEAPDQQASADAADAIAADEPTAEAPDQQDAVDAAVADEPTAEAPDQRDAADAAVADDEEDATPDAAVAPPAAPTPATIRAAAPVQDPTGSAAPAEPWGRVADDGTVFVREEAGWREVGQFPDGSPDEALAYFERKYSDLADRVTLLEQRQRRGGASASELRTAAEHLTSDIEGAAAVGDLAALSDRVSALVAILGAVSEAEAAANRAAVEEAIRTRTELVERAEALAAQDPKSIQWKSTTAELSALFDQWQAQQQAGPRLPKAASQQLWSRFRTARASLEKHRREFYAELDEQHRAVRDRKSQLVEKAEALVSKGEDGIPAYRELHDRWKTAGRAGKKSDDALWARFKAAGDALYQARAQRDAAEAEASAEKIEQREALLREAVAVDDEKDIAKARALLTGIQRRWDAIGRIFPREKERALDDSLRKIEQALRTREESDWKRNNPETRARANDMTRQLNEAIEKLEADVAAAKKAGDEKAVAEAEEALKARRAWLSALGS